MPLPHIDPPLLNSSNPWATTTEDLQALFDCPSTGAVTTRTSLLDGFEHDDAIHQRTFFNPSDHSLRPSHLHDGDVPATYAGSLNTLGYSPIPLSTYLSMIKDVVARSTQPEPTRSTKPFIISVTGSAAAVRECYTRIQHAQASMANPLCMEINLSCPNIPDKPPPAYSGPALAEYLRLLAEVPPPTAQGGRRVAVGIKTPPYTYHDQFATLVAALRDARIGPDGTGKGEARCVVDFITATNTLGSCLVVHDDAGGSPALHSASGQGIGGMAGAGLHPLALGNVRTIRGMLDGYEGLKGVEVIGVGGVGDQAGWRRMRAVGAEVVGVGSALGREGVGVFGRILKG